MTGDLVVDSGGRVDVNAKGYQSGGPGAGHNLSALIERDRFLDVGARELACEVVHESLCTRPTEPPSVAGVGFLGVDDDEFDLVVKLLVKFFETHGPVTERRSGVAAEDEGDGPFSTKIREADSYVALGILQLEVRGQIADLG